MKFTEKQLHPWVCDMRRGDVQCPYVTMLTSSYQCCTWKVGHPESLPHEVCDDQPSPPPAREWILKECAENLLRKR
jgi:hypothetical protein